MNISLAVARKALREFQLRTKATPTKILCSSRTLIWVRDEIDQRSLYTPEEGGETTLFGIPLVEDNEVPDGHIAFVYKTYQAPAVSLEGA